MNIDIANFTVGYSPTQSADGLNRHPSVMYVQNMQLWLSTMCSADRHNIARRIAQLFNTCQVQVYE